MRKIPRASAITFADSIVCESGVVCFVAFILAMILAWLLLPSFSSMLALGFSAHVSISATQRGFASLLFHSVRTIPLGLRQSVANQCSSRAGKAKIQAVAVVCDVSSVFCNSQP